MTAISRLDRRVAGAFYGRFRDLRPAQEAAIEPLLAGQNVVLSAGTGSGKTEAVMAPILSRYWREASLSDVPAILYIAPTKALVNDLEKRLGPCLETLNLRVGVRHGDRDDLKHYIQPHVLITTPESLDVLLARKDPALTSLQAVIIDEVHLLYNTQRGLQLSILLQRLRSRLGRPFQWAALSATVGRLSDVRAFLFGASEPAIFLSFPAHRRIDAHIAHPANEQAFLDLVHRLTSRRPVKLLIFANSRRICERLAGLLSSDERSRHVVFAHYSSLSPEVRVETEANFAATRAAICVATSTLELGIDIGDIDAVLLWDVPGGVESFLQRIGRGNRRTQKANVICLVPDDATHVVSSALRFLALINAAKNGELPIRAPYALYGAAGQQCLGIIASEGGRYTRIAELCDLMSHQHHLDRSVIENILGDLALAGYLQAHGFKNQYGADDRLYDLVDFRLIYGNFGAGSQLVEIRHGAKTLGTVPATNLLRIGRGMRVRFVGAVWHVRKAAPEGIEIEPASSHGDAVDFTYPGRRGGSDPFLADRMWNLIHSSNPPLDLLDPALRHSVTIAIEHVRATCRQDQLPYVRETAGIRYLTFAGYWVNKAIALMTHQTRFTADDYSLLVSNPINWAALYTDPQRYQPIFPLLFEATAEQSLYQTLLPDELRLDEFLQLWLRDETIPAVLQRLSQAELVPISASVANGIIEPIG